MFNASVLGTIGNDPDLKNVGNSEVTTFSLAIDRYRRKVKETLWIKIEAWGNAAKTLHQYAKKGDQICLSGDLDVQEWDDRKSGEKRSQIVLKVSHFSFVRRSKAAQDDQYSDLDAF